MKFILQVISQIIYILIMWVLVIPMGLTLKYIVRFGNLFRVDFRTKAEKAYDSLKELDELLRMKD